ncbi:hypothetical protein COCOBI_16-1780 [Coccomyxa sp. Obi]|nr:hypothetical protein COCOBI_16-1780 [Coccomyxa sp. Obi]
MKGIFAYAVGALLLAAVSVHALTQTPVDVQPYGLITEAQIPATAATCKAALDAAVKIVTATNGDFTGVTQPTGATLANSEYLYCFTAPGFNGDIGNMKLTVFPGELQGKTLGQELMDTTWPQASSFMSLVLNQVQQMITTPQYAVLFYSWDVKDQANKTPAQKKYDLLEGFTVGANKYGCGCGYKLVSYQIGNINIRV